MIDFPTFLLYLLVCAGVTYLIRVIPLILIKKKIKNRFIQSFLYYIPYAVLSVMTIPAIFYSTSSIWSALAGMVMALILSFFGKSLIIVALSACGVSLIVELIQHYFF